MPCIIECRVLLIVTHRNVYRKAEVGYLLLCTTECRVLLVVTHRTVCRKVEVRTFYLALSSAMCCPERRPGDF